MSKGICGTLQFLVPVALPLPTGPFCQVTRATSTLSDAVPEAEMAESVVWMLVPMGTATFIIGGVWSCAEATGLVTITDFTAVRCWASVAVRVIVVFPGGVGTVAAEKSVPVKIARPDAPWSVCQETLTAPDPLAAEAFTFTALVFTGTGPVVGDCIDSMNTEAAGALVAGMFGAP